MHLGVVGLGIMGCSIARRLLNEGHTVAIYNRTPEKARVLLDIGAHWATTPGEVAAQSEVIISMVTDPAAVEHVTFGRDGILQALSKESVHCDMSTVSLTWARHMEHVYYYRGKRFVQAPVLGNWHHAEDGQLLIFAGGPRDDFQVCEPVLRNLSGRTWHLPSAGQAAITKLALNALLAHLMVGLGQSLLLAQKGGVDPAILLEILENSSVGNAMFTRKGKALLERDFRPNFYTRHMLKDIKLAADAGHETGTPLPLNAITLELLLSAVQQGNGNEDYASVVKVLERLAGIELKSQTAQ